LDNLAGSYMGSRDLFVCAKLSALVFFYEHLKPMADEYIKERGNKQ